jgi:UPF0716 protein FxsA
MLLVLFLVFLVTPVVEIAVFIKVGGLIGTQATVAIVLFNAILGAALLRSQGLTTLRRAQESLERGEPPVEAVVDGVGLIVAGALMITPGLVTDAIGFLLLIPPLRRWVTMALFRRLARSSMVHFQVLHSSHHTGPHTGPSGFGPQPQTNETIIDGEWEVVDEPPDPQSRTPGQSATPLGKSGTRPPHGKGPHATRR